MEAGAVEAGAVGRVRRGFAGGLPGASGSGNVCRCCWARKGSTGPTANSAIPQAIAGRKLRKERKRGLTGLLGEAGNVLCARERMERGGGRGIRATVSAGTPGANLPPP